MTRIPQGSGDTDFEILEIIDLSDTGPREIAPGTGAGADPGAGGAAGAGVGARSVGAHGRHAPLAPTPHAERMRAKREAAADLLKQLLPSLDALELCVREDPDPAQLEQGVRMALRGLWNVFRPFELERIEGHGMVFDPRMHEAAVITPSDRVPVNTVLETLRVGYTLGGELVRPALVRVSVEQLEHVADPRAGQGPAATDAAADPGEAAAELDLADEGKEEDGGTNA